MAAPSYLWVYVVLTIAIISLTILAGVIAALTATDYPRAEVRRSTMLTVLLLAGWIAFSAALAAASAVVPLLALPGVRLALGGLIAAGFCMAVLRTPTGARIIHAVPQSWLVGVQVYRLLGAIFLVLYGLHQLPAAFALPAGIGDVTVAALALPVAGIYWAGWPLREALLWAWNVFGIADLAVALTMGALTMPTLHLFPGVSSALLSSWPLIMVPLFAVPLSIVLHIASLRKLGWDRELAAHMSHATA
jgi:hypothetical protein